MVFKECSIGGVTFRDQMDNLICTDQNLSTTRFNERALAVFVPCKGLFELHFGPGPMSRSLFWSELCRDI